MRVLINTPDLSLAGGVANHYSGLLPFWTEEIDYNPVGSRGGFPAFVCLVYDYLKFIALLTFRRYDLVVLNPSLGRTAILRDSIFLALAKFLGKRSIVFFHGWDPCQERLVDLRPSEFKRKFYLADAFIVLAGEFVRKLQGWGLRAPIYLSTTKVDDRLIAGFDVDDKRYTKNVLFLARLETSKGILIALEAFAEVLARHPDARLVVAGAGSASESAAEFVKSRAIPRVTFLGNIYGVDLVKAYSEADVYVLPTMHEGMPTSVLEAMAFGLPVVTRSVGGLVDFFEHSKMGFISDSLDAHWFADAISTLLSDPGLMKKIGRYNHAYAKRHFLASKVARQLEEVMKQV